MPTPTEYRDEAAEYLRQADLASASRRFELLDMAKACLQLADHEEWLRMGYKYH
jgi:hypothetical protein